jgi:UDP-N-acetylglucosamine 2-epimerase (non-hydrolysing)
MSKLRVATIVGTRPEIIRLSRVIPKLDQHFTHTLVHSGQNYDYELNEIFFEDLSVRRPDFFLDAVGENASQTIAKVIEKSGLFFSKNPQDAVLILGDTNTALSAISAKKRKIPIFHMEAGNRSFDQRVPEEINRKIVDHISDINLPYTKIAREYLIAEGIKPDQIIKTGSPMDEIINHYRKSMESSEILSELGLHEDKFFLLSSHREENIDTNNFNKLIHLIEKLIVEFKIPILISTHPRTRKNIESKKIKLPELAIMHKPLSFSDYSKLQTTAKVVLSDSGSITEESSILNFPALNIREAHERPEGFEEGAVMMTGLEVDKVFAGIEILSGQPKGETRLLNVVNDYLSPNLSDKVVRIILSHVDFINKRVWKKDI